MLQSLDLERTRGKIGRDGVVYLGREGADGREGEAIEWSRLIFASTHTKHSHIYRFSVKNTGIAPPITGRGSPSSTSFVPNTALASAWTVVGSRVVCGAVDSQWEAIQRLVSPVRADGSFDAFLGTAPSYRKLRGLNCHHHHIFEHIFELSRSRLIFAGLLLLRCRR